MTSILTGQSVLVYGHFKQYSHNVKLAIMQWGLAAGRNIFCPLSEEPVSRCRLMGSLPAMGFPFTLYP